MPVSGGDKLQAALAAIVGKLKSADTVQVGFMADSTYPNGTPTALVAATMEFGGTVNVPEHTTTIYRQVNATGTAFNKNSRFVKQDKSNFASDHTVPTHTITIPPRPYFRGMIAKDGPGWGKQMGKVLKASDYDAATTLQFMGEEIAGQLQASIKATNDPPLAQSPIAAKGFATPLIDTGHMLNSVSYVVKT